MNLICGINPVLEALAAGTRQFDRLLVAKGVRNRRVADAIRRATELGVPLRFEGRHALDRMASGVNHQGIIAVVSAKSVLDLEDLINQARDPGVLVVLDGVEDPRNLGAIVRTVEAAGADGVVLPERHSAPLSETVGRASAGALEHVRIARVGNLSQTLARVKARGYWVVGFDAAGDDHWHAADFRRSVALVFGGEGRGMRRLVRESCDQLVSLPLFGHVSSLNVSVAAGAALYEVIRQRGYVPSHVRPIPARATARSREIIGPSPEDAEEDPGHLGPPETSPVTNEGEAEGGEQAPHTISVIDLHEEVGWARHVPVTVEGRQVRPRRQREAGAADGGGDRWRAAGGRAARSRPAGRRRRRRVGSRRPDRPDGTPGVSHEASPEADRGREVPSHDDRAAAPEQRGEPAAPPAARRKRRRRRRRR